MPRKAKSQTKKKQEYQDEWETLMDEAVKVYQEELGKKGGGKGCRAVANELMEEHFQKTGHRVYLSHQTINERAKGRKSKSHAADSKKHLTNEETEIVIEYAIVCANQGFPLSHRRLKEHIEELLRARMGPSFPGVGKKFTARFVEKNSDRLRTCWASPLESKRADAANPTTNKAWWEVLLKTMQDHNIKEHNTYAVDEVGCQPYGAERERVIGPIRRAPQYQCRTGSRENMTVLVSICADDNPANASIGYSQKGWTNNEIGLDWLKLFDQQTKDKAGSDARLLLVDGHSLHYSRPFLEYARENNILILCYPSHTTHIYQGLDVVIFATLKLRLSQEPDTFVRQHMAEITKENFLAIYGRAHIATLTPDNVKSVFRKTGVWPYNPDVVTPEMLAPSRPASIESNLPVPPPTPVKLLSKLLIDLSLEDDHGLAPINEDDEDYSPPPSPSEAQKKCRIDLVAETAKALAKTRIAPLLEGGRDGADLIMGSMKTSSDLINPKPPSHIETLLTMTATTANKAMLLAALRESQDQLTYYKGRVITLQAANILNESYCAQLQQQLNTKRAKGKGKGKGRLLGDGLPRLMTADEFYGRVVAASDLQDREEAVKAAKAQANLDFKEAKKRWDEDEEERKRENAARTERHKAAMTKWEAAKAAAKDKKKPFSKPKPKKEEIEKQAPKPKLKDFEAEALRRLDEAESEGSEVEEDEEDEEEGEEEDFDDD